MGGNRALATLEVPFKSLRLRRWGSRAHHSSRPKVDPAPWQQGEREPTR